MRGKRKLYTATSPDDDFFETKLQKVAKVSFKETSIFDCGSFVFGSPGELKVFFSASNSFLNLKFLTI